VDRSFSERSSGKHEYNEKLVIILSREARQAPHLPVTVSVSMEEAQLHMCLALREEFRHDQRRTRMVNFAR